MRSDAAIAIRAIEYDLGDMATLQTWNKLQHIADAAIQTGRRDTNGQWIPNTDAERLLNLRNAMLMELTGRVSDDEEIWRVAVNPLGVSALHIGLGAKPEIRSGSLAGLPEWMQERVSVLSMLSESPPTTPIEGVGRRITDSVYWIVK